MNVALPALVLFLLLLPGFVIRTRLKRAERTSFDYSPFGQVVAEAVLWAFIMHLLWLLAADVVFGRDLDPRVPLKLLSAEPAGQARAAEAVAASFGWISTYFLTLLLASFAFPKLVRHIISAWHLDRDSARFSSIFRFHDAPWYYLLTGADFAENEQPDAIVISAVVSVAGEAVLYTGFLDEFFFNPEGQLDRLVLRTVMRRPMAADKGGLANQEDPDQSNRFYPVDGDYFVLRYSEAITLKCPICEADTGDSEGSANTVSGGVRVTMFLSQEFDKHGRSG